MTTRASHGMLVAVTVAAATAWAVWSLVVGRSPTNVLPAAVAAVTAAVVIGTRSRAGLSTGTSSVPAWFVPSVLVAALAGTITWGVLDGSTAGARVGVAALVMASPAAVMLSAPLAFATGAARARSHGVRVGGIGALEAVGDIDTLVLSKDGTVTTGDLTVVSVDPVEPDHDRNLRWFAGALEKASDHRVGRAVATLSARGQLSDVEVVEGRGISGSVDRHPVRVGAPDWIGIVTTPTIWTTVGVEVDGRTLGSITVADDVRPDLTRDIERLTALGLELVLVSADTDDRTRHVAALAGIDTFHAGCTPDRTAEIVRELSARGRTVATAGITDPSAVLTFGTADSSASGATVVSDDLSPARLAQAIEIVRATAGRVRRSSTTAVVLGGVGVVIALTGLAGPVVMATTAAAVVVATAAVATSA